MGKADKQSWPFIRRRKYPSGLIAWQVDARTKDGGERKTFDTRLEAETFAQQQRTKRTNEGLVGFALTGEDRIDAEAALSIVKAHGRTLREAADFFVRHLHVIKAGKTIPQLVDELLAAKIRDGASARYLKDLRTRLKAFASAFADSKVAEITTTAIDDWLRDLPWSPVTRNNYRRLLSVLFTYATRRKYCVENPIVDTETAKVVKTRPGFLTVDQSRKLLDAADSEILPAIVLGLFAGLRPESEVWRLDWSKIDFAARHIDISADATKIIAEDGASQRYVTMPDCLIAWLLPHQQSHGPVSPTGDKYFTLLERAREKAGIKKWPHDALRHTYGSMHYAHHKNIPLTMAEMGHTNPKTFFRHYRARIQPTEAAKYWMINPGES